MPRVPTYDSFQASSTSLPQARVTAPDMPDIAGQQAQQMGRGLIQGGVAASQMAVDMQNQANQLRFDDAANKAKEIALKLRFDKDQGYLNLRGVNALERPDGKPLAEEYGEKLNTEISNIAGTLGNDAQRKAFARFSSNLLTEFKGQAIQHEAQEFRTHALSVSEGIQSTSFRDIALNYNNPEAIDAAVGRLQAETYRQAQLLGKSAEWQEAQARKITSGAHKVALLTALENNDPTYADAYLKKYSPQMDADDILAVRGHITKEMDARVGLTVAGEAIKKVMPRIQSSDSERAFNVALNTESGGRQFGSDGKPLTSPKGAVGIAQVMPTTGPEAAKLAGLEWDEARYKNDASYNKALGMAYFQKQLQDNGGDLAKAYAAYNAGPGRLQDAIKKAEKSVALAKNDPSVQVHTWLDFMPAETRDYVTKNMKAYESGGGVAQKPTFQEIDDALRSDPRLSSNPARYKVAREEALRQFNEQEKAVKLREEEGIQQVQLALIENGGNYAALPASKKALVPPGKYDDVLAYAGKVAAGQPTTTDWNVYTQLRAQAANDPSKFASTDLRVHYPSLAPQQREQLLDLQMKAKDPKQQPEVTSLSQQLTVAHELLGFGKSDMEKKGKFDDAVSQAIALETRTKKRDLSFEERDQIIKRMMLPTNVSSWGMSKPLYQVSGTPEGTNAKPKMGDDDRKMIIAALKNEGIPQTESNILSRFNLRYGIK